MKITANYYQPTTYPQTAMKGKSGEKVASSSFTISKADTTASAKPAGDVWKELKEKYDIRHCTMKDLCDIASKLYSAGEISGGECAIMMFDWKRAGVLQYLSPLVR